MEITLKESALHMPSPKELGMVRLRKGSFKADKCLPRSTWKGKRFDCLVGEEGQSPLKRRRSTKAGLSHR